MNAKIKGVSTKWKVWGAQEKNYLKKVIVKVIVLSFFSFR